MDKIKLTQLFDCYHKGIITEHEVVASLHGQKVDASSLPEFWKDALLKFKQKVGDRELVSFYIKA